MKKMILTLSSVLLLVLAQCSLAASSAVMTVKNLCKSAEVVLVKSVSGSPCSVNNLPRFHSDKKNISSGETGKFKLVNHYSEYYKGKDGRTKEKKGGDCAYYLSIIASSTSHSPIFEKTEFKAKPGGKYHLITHSNGKCAIAMRGGEGISSK